MHACLQLSSVPPPHPLIIQLVGAQIQPSIEPRTQNQLWIPIMPLTMEYHLMILIVSLAFVCRALGSTIPSLPVGAVLLERASRMRPVYDYVVVGGGTSGLVVANRLTEDPKSTCVRPSLVGSFASLIVIHWLTRRVSSQRPCRRVWLRVRTRVFFSIGRLFV